MRSGAKVPRDFYDRATDMCMEYTDVGTSSYHREQSESCFKVSGGFPPFLLPRTRGTRSDETSFVAWTPCIEAIVAG